MKIFTTEALRSIDSRTIESGEATAMQLIEQVAEGAVAEILRHWKPSQPTVVFAGSGNNGADALAVARLLAEQGFDPHVFLFNIGGNRLSAECVTARDMLLSAVPGVRFSEIVDRFVLPELSHRWLVIDGLFGSGLRGALTGGFQELVRKINDSGASVVSLDVPSGLHGDWNPEAVARNIIHADLTLSVGFPRIAFFFRDNDEIVGEWRVLDLALSEKTVRSTPSDYFYVQRHDIRPLLPPRDKFASKAELGSALLVAGSYGMMGAACLAARGALRAGIGRLSLQVPRCGMQVVQTAVSEAVVVPDKQDFAISDIVLQHEYGAVGLGCGLGLNESTLNAVEHFLSNYNRPVVIDADALNCIHLRPRLLKFLPESSILTPHAGEFDRIFGAQPSAESRLLKAAEVARQYKIIIVLKGRYTAVVRPDGKVYFNSSGTPAMATPGAGDVLTGVITSLLGQGMRPEIAAVVGVYVHGLAGEIAASANGVYGTVAGDIADAVGRAIMEITK